MILDLHPNEKIIAVARKHWLAFLGNVAIALMMTLFFAFMIVFGNALVSDLSSAKIFSILTEYLWLFEDIILAAISLAALLYVLIRVGKKYTNSAVITEILGVFNRHQFAFVTGYILFIIIALLFSAIIVLNAQSKMESIFDGVNRNEIAQNIGLGVLIIIGGMYALSIVAYSYISWLDFYMDIFIITSRRIVRIEQIMLFNRKTSETSFQHVQDASAHVKGFLYGFLDIGGIFVETAGEKENFSFSPIPHPNEIATKILELQRAEWLDEGIKDEFAHQRIVEEGMHLVEEEVKEQMPIIEKVILAREEQREHDNKKHYNDGRIIIEEGVIWQSEQELDDEILNTLKEMG